MLIDDVTPPAAPTAAVKRRGKAIRNRRRIGVATGLAVAIVVAALVPGLLRHSHAGGPISPQHKSPNVTVGIVGRGAPAGLIARGAIDSKPWRITLSWQGNNLCVGTSADVPQAGCGPSDSYAADEPATLIETGGGAVNAFYGVVAARATRVSIALSDDVVLSLRPVGFDGRWWIGVELPAKLAVTRVVAYSRSGELTYAIPFTVARSGLPGVVDWLRPGARARPICPADRVGRERGQALVDHG